jgi:hypothetical protein
MCCQAGERSGIINVFALMPYQGEEEKAPSSFLQAAKARTASAMTISANW